LEETICQGKQDVFKTILILNLAIKYYAKQVMHHHKRGHFLPINFLAKKKSSANASRKLSDKTSKIPSAKPSKMAPSKPRQVSSNKPFAKVDKNCLLNRERLYSVQANALESYLEHFLQPRFWLGTKFFVWLTNMYGIEIIMIFHFFFINTVGRCSVSMVNTKNTLKS
jgi:hypothetical protein